MTRHGLTRVLILFVLATSITSPGRTQNHNHPDYDKTALDGSWMSLFNGKDLDGWKIKIAGHELNENYGNTFRVEQGILKVAYDRYAKFSGEFGHLFYKLKNN